MSVPLEDTSAIVTGASSGIGAATARRLAEDGADVALAARRAKRLEALEAELRVQHDAGVLVQPTDVTDENAVSELVEAAVDRFGGFDLLVNNAGTAEGSLVEELATEDHRQMGAVSCDGMVDAACAALLPPSCRRGNDRVRG